MPVHAAALRRAAPLQICLARSSAALSHVHSYSLGKVAGCAIGGKSFLSTTALARQQQQQQVGKTGSRLERLRNVSFWGHIDAGKTTLTERVLYLSGALSPPTPSSSNENGNGTSQAKKAVNSGQMPGDVDSGSTVTDFLEAERERGITIQSAAVGPFSWSPSSSRSSSSSSSAEGKVDITLVDTPGHIDFTIEVERSLRVADGCVVLVDGVEGVESQTEGVWNIAQRYNVRSHIVFVNKLDRMGASLRRSIASIVDRGLHPRPVLLQLPVYATTSSSQSSSGQDDESIVGLIDLVDENLQVHYFGGKAGEIVDRVGIQEAVERRGMGKALAEEAQRAREALVESVASLDEELLEHVLAESGSTPSNLLRPAIRRLVAKGEILAVLCGSAQKNVGVQNVLDAIAWYLPSPIEAGDFDAGAARGVEGGCVWATVNAQETGTQQAPSKAAHRKKGSEVVRKEGPNPSTEPASFSEVANAEENRVSISVKDGELAALAFKVVWDKRKGPMTFVRVYAGTLSRSSTLLNTTTHTKERLSKLLLPYADQLIETDEIDAGQIAVLLGLRDTRTGDTLVDSRASSSKVAPWATHAKVLRLRRVDVPPPVFSMSVEALSKSDEPSVKEALDMLVRTDPSLRLDDGSSSSTDGSGGLGAAGTGQTVLSGMGELHLEIAKDRLTGEFGAKANLGGVRVSYRETVVGEEEGAEGATVLQEMLDREMMGKPLKAGLELRLRRLNAEEDGPGDETLGGNLIEIELDEELERGGNEKSASAVAKRSDEVLDGAAIRHAIRAGLVAGLSRGPLTSNPLSGLHITVSQVQTFGQDLTPAKALSFAASSALRKAVKERGAKMMEPVMKLRVTCQEAHLGKVVGDLTSEQHATVEQVDHEGLAEQGAESAGGSTTADRLQGVYLPPPPANATLESSSSSSSPDASGSFDLSPSDARHRTTIHALAPLARLVSYSSRLRALTAGSGTFTMQLAGFQTVGNDREKEILTSLGRM